jgi:hypothetical protein
MKFAARYCTIYASPSGPNEPLNEALFKIATDAGLRPSPDSTREVRSGRGAGSGYALEIEIDWYETDKENAIRGVASVMRRTHAARCPAPLFGTDSSPHAQFAAIVGPLATCAFIM